MKIQECYYLGPKGAYKKGSLIKVLPASIVGSRVAYGNYCVCDKDTGELFVSERVFMDSMGGDFSSWDYDKFPILDRVNKEHIIPDDLTLYVHFDLFHKYVFDKLKGKFWIHTDGAGMLMAELIEVDVDKKIISTKETESTRETTYEYVGHIVFVTPSSRIEIVPDMFDGEKGVSIAKMEY